jgi:glycerate kinase
MRVLVAPDCFTGTLSAPQAAVAIADGWRRQAPHDEITLCPLSDGGPGFLDVLHAALGGRLAGVTVAGPLGDPVPAAVLMVGDTAYVESAQACGLHLVPPARRDPWVTTTAGVGELMAHARELGAVRIVLGLGGSATNDAGAGLLAALADLDGPVGERLRSGGGGLRGTDRAELDWLPALRRAWEPVELVLASDVDSPLLGFHGASAGFAEQKGATAEQAQDLERCLGDFAAAATAALGDPGSSGAEPGAGAAGGLGFALLLLGARRTPGVRAVLEAVGFADRLAGADLVITGEGRFDWQSLRGKVVAGVAEAALTTGTPVVVVAGQVLVGRREAQVIGVDAAYPVARTPAEIDAAMAEPYASLAARAQRVARTWSPGRAGPGGYPG